MLTKNDLITILDQRLDLKLDQKLSPIHKDVKVIKKDVKTLRIDLDGVINMADKGLLNTQTRLKAVEKKLGFEDFDFV